MFPRRLFGFVGIALFVAIIFTVITMSSRSVLPVSGMERLALSIASPFFQTVTISLQFTRNIWQTYFQNAGAVHENRLLKVRLAQTEELRNQYEELSLENARLKKFVNFTRSVPDTYVAARIIARDPSPWFQTVIIDKGSNDGLEKGSPVLVSEGIVGQVIEIAGGYARVLLIIDRNSSVDALVQNSRVRGIVKGNNEETCSFVYTLRKDEIREGEVIVTSGLDQVFPKGLVVGRVLSVTKTQTQLFQDVSVETSVDFDKLEEVLVLKK